MLPSNPVCPVCNYATSAVYCDLPSPEQLVNGVKPLDSLPAAWWNGMWNMINCSVNQARSAIGSFITEINNVLAGAGICPNCVCTDQLYRAIEKIQQTIGNATAAGSVKSSATPGMVSIDDNGLMTANCVGNATQLTTSARTLVGAVNELKTTYDTCFGNVSTTLGGKAPINHAVAESTYGVGTATAYGHLRISDTYTSDIGDPGAAASQSALYNVYDYAKQIAESGAILGNVLACPLGAASAGTATTAARSDHVHPLPTCVACAECATCATCAQKATSAGTATDATYAYSSGHAVCATCVVYREHAACIYVCATENGSCGAFCIYCICLRACALAGDYVLIAPWICGNCEGDCYACYYAGRVARSELWTLYDDYAYTSNYLGNTGIWWSFKVPGIVLYK